MHRTRAALLHCGLYKYIYKKFFIINTTGPVHILYENWGRGRQPTNGIRRRLVVRAEREADPPPSFRQVRGLGAPVQVAEEERWEGLRVEAPKGTADRYAL